MHEEELDPEEGKKTFSSASKIEVEQCIKYADMIEWKKILLEVYDNARPTILIILLINQNQHYSLKVE